MNKFQNVFVAFLVGASAGTFLGTVILDVMKPFTTMAGIVKRQSVFMKEAEEASPIVIKNQPAVFINTREDLKGKEFVFKTWAGENLKSFPTDISCGAALNFKNEIIISGIRGVNSGNKVVITRFNQDLQFLEEFDAFTVPKGALVDNTSITYDGNNFIMAYQYWDNWDNRTEGHPYIKFMVSKDLRAWQPIGDKLEHNGGKYAAAPTIKFSEGNYYIFYTATHKMKNPYKGLEYEFYTTVARTRDFNSFEFGNPVLVPDYAFDNVDNADMDLMEFEGIVYITHHVGTQHGQGDLKIAVYVGDMSHMLNQMF